MQRDRGGGDRLHRALELADLVVGGDEDRQRRVLVVEHELGAVARPQVGKGGGQVVEVYDGFGVHPEGLTFGMLGVGHGDGGFGTYHHRQDGALEFAVLRGLGHLAAHPVKQCGQLRPLHRAVGLESAVGVALHDALAHRHRHEAHRPGGYGGCVLEGQLLGLELVGLRGQPHGPHQHHHHVQTAGRGVGLYGGRAVAHQVTQETLLVGDHQVAHGPAGGGQHRGPVAVVQPLVHAGQRLVLQAHEAHRQRDQLGPGDGAVGSEGAVVITPEKAVEHRLGDVLLGPGAHAGVGKADPLPGGQLLGQTRGRGGPRGKHRAGHEGEDEDGSCHDGNHASHGVPLPLRSKVRRRACPPSHLITPRTGSGIWGGAPSGAQPVAAPRAAARSRPSACASASACASPRMAPRASTPRTLSSRW